MRHGVGPGILWVKVSLPPGEPRFAGDQSYSNVLSGPKQGQRRLALRDQQLMGNGKKFTNPKYFSRCSA
jgi:hypothetical protein